MSILKVLLLWQAAEASDLLPLHGGVGRACRGISGQEAHAWEGWTAKDLAQCKSICGDCTAVQYEAETSSCRLWKVPVVHTIKQQGSECYAKAADTNALTDMLPKNTTCLATAAKCSDSADRASCLTRKEYANNPCVWCGGAVCNDRTRALCESFESWKAGSAMETVGYQEAGASEVARCELARPAVIEVKPAEWRPAAPGPDDLLPLKTATAGCKSLTSKEACLASKDWGDVKDIKFLKVYGEACVWCGGGLCTTADQSTCGAFDFLMNGEGVAFDIFHAKHSFEVAGATAVPTNWDGQCLQKAERGCPALSDEYSCLSSLDGRDSVFAGLKVQGQPCVWCNGGYCNSNGNRCEAHNVQVQGKGKVFNHSLAPGMTTAGCEGGLVKQHLPPFRTTPPFPITRPAETSCLKAEPKGCAAIQGKLTCLSSYDGSDVKSIGGMRVQGEPCVWCGGGQCHTGDDSLCAPFDYLEKGVGRAFGAVNAVALTPAQCSSVDADFGQLSCLSSADSGCNAISSFEQCVGSVDGRPYEQVAGFKVAGQPCVWCGGRSCAGSGSANMCEPYDFAIHGAGHAYDLHVVQVAYYRASCNSTNKPHALKIEPPAPEHTAISAGTLDASEADLGASGPEFLPASASMAKPGEPKPDWYAGNDKSCLQTVSDCSLVRDKLICLSSKDGRYGLMKDGLNVGGEACVWCGGQPCTSNGDSLCQPEDWLHNGEGKAFTSFTARDNHKVAQCWQISRPSIGTLDCLKVQSNGCNNIRDADTCLSSTDGRPYVRVAGFKVQGQPCVWCGGRPCTENNDNLCEPLDFVQNGNGYAFKSVPGQRSMAGCSMGSPVALPMPAAANVMNLKEALQQDAAPPPASHPLQNIGQDCWYECGQESGFCSFCGTGNACCRQDLGENAPAECKGPLTFTTWHHECVAPLQSNQQANADAKAAVAAAGAAASAGIGATAAAAANVALPPANYPLQNIGKDCWYECGEKSGLCSFCGTGNACCRQDLGENAQGLSPEAAAQISAAGAQQAAMAAHASPTEQQQVAVKEAVVAAKAAMGDLTPEEKVAAIALSAAEAGAAAGMSSAEQSQAAAAAAGEYAAEAQLSTQEAARIAGEGAARASKAAGESPSQQTAAAMGAVAVAAAAASSAKGESGQQLAATVAEAVKQAAAEAGLSPSEQLKQVQSALSLHAKDVGLTQEQLNGIASAAVPAAVAGAGVQIGVTAPPDPFAAGMAAADEAAAKKESPNQQVLAAGKAAFKAAEGNSDTLAQQAEYVEKAGEAAAEKAGLSKSDAEEVAAAAANAVSGGNVNSDALKVLPGSEGGAPHAAASAEYHASPAEVDAEKAGAEAARVAKAQGESPEHQVEEACIAAGRAAKTGGMDAVGQEEAARKVKSGLLHVDDPVNTGVPSELDLKCKWLAFADLQAKRTDEWREEEPHGVVLVQLRQGTGFPEEAVGRKGLRWKCWLDEGAVVLSSGGKPPGHPDFQIPLPQCLYHVTDQLTARGVPSAEIAEIVEVQEVQVSQYLRAKSDFMESQAQRKLENSEVQCLELCWHETLALLVKTPAAQVQLSLLDGHDRTVGRLEPISVRHAMSGHLEKDITRKLSFEQSGNEAPSMGRLSAWMFPACTAPVLSRDRYQAVRMQVSVRYRALAGAPTSSEST
ncbi:unnamed protein product [Effrenium voratum]|nr:unnamed protein product [Effrenium voratum]